MRFKIYVFKKKINALKNDMKALNRQPRQVRPPRVANVQRQQKRRQNNKDRGQ